MADLSGWVADSDFDGRRLAELSAGCTQTFESDLPGRDLTGLALAAAGLAVPDLAGAGRLDFAFTAFALPGLAGLADLALAASADLDFLDDAITEVWWLARK